MTTYKCPHCGRLFHTDDFCPVCDHKSAGWAGYTQSRRSHSTAGYSPVGGIRTVDSGRFKQAMKPERITD